MHIISPHYPQPSIALQRRIVCTIHLLPDSSCELSSHVVSLLYQILEWSLSHQDNTPLPASVLTRLVTWLGTLAKKRKEMAARVRKCICNDTMVTQQMRAISKIYPINDDDDDDDDDYGDDDLFLI